MADPERGLGGGGNIKEEHQFRKNNQISHAYGLTGNKDQTFVIKIALFSCYIEEYIDFVPFSGALRDNGAFDPIGSAFEGHGSPLPVNTCMRIVTYRI